MTNNTISTFDFRDIELRVITINNEPWFVAADARAILGIKQSGSNFTYLDCDEKRNITRSSEVGPLLFANSRDPRLTLISESGLYKMIMRSDKPEAKPFQNYVTKVILPTIRKDGMYVSGEEKIATGEMFDDELTLLVMTRLQNKVDNNVVKAAFR